MRARGRSISVNSALRLTGIDAFYGDSHVLQKVSFELGEARLLGLLGRNGAGKSTCMNVTVGLLPPRAGSVEVFGTSVTRMAPEEIAAHGVALVPQGRRIFKSLTARENLIVAARRVPLPTLPQIPHPTLPRERGRVGWGQERVGRGRTDAQPDRRADWTLDTVFDMF